MHARAHAAAFLRWSKYILQNGLPDAVFYFEGGLGDQLLCSALVREIRRREGKNIWLMTNAAELFARNRDVRLVLPYDIWLFPWLRLNGTPARQVCYQDLVPGEPRHAPLHEHCIAAMCRQAGISGRVALRPYLPSVENAGGVGSRSRPRIAIQSSCMNARYPMANKQWPVDRFQHVVDSLAAEVDFVQVGVSSDPLLHGADDMRGRVGYLDAARILRDSDLFVGLVGFLMHLARAVECPAVIIYGGRETPKTTGYSCNINLATSPPCAPCWYYSHCDYDRMCLAEISAASVVEAIRRLLASKVSRPLKVDFAEIA